MPLHLTTLGRLHLQAEDGTEVRALLAQPKRMAVLVYLAMQPEGRYARRDTLLGLFWPELAQERARTALRKALHFIRQTTGGELFDSRGAEEIALRPGALEADALAFRRLAAEGRDDEALALYGGDFLPGFYIAGAPAFEQWLDSERDALRDRAAESARSAADAALAAGQPHRARACAERALALSPEDEDALRRHLELLGRVGDRSGALAAYRTFAARLQAEYGAQPSPETQAMVAALRAAPPAPPQPVLPPEPIAPLAEEPDDVDEPEAEPIPRAVVSAAPSEPPSVERELARRLESPVQPREEPAAAPEPTSAATSAQTPRRRRIPRRWAAALAGIALAAAAGVAVAIVGGRIDAEADEEAQRIAVLPFAVSGPGETAYLEHGLPLLLSTRLDGAGSLKAVDAREAPSPAAAWPGAGTLARADDAARRLGAGLYVVGSVTGPADRLHIAASLYDRRRGDQPVASIVVEGSESSLHAVADELATRLLDGYLHERAVGMTATVARTTRSPAALKLWLRGEDAFRRGRYEPALADFEAAVRADTTFALAHYRLAVAASWAGRHGLVVPAARRAVALEGRLSSPQRTMARALLASREGRQRDAEALYRQATETRPGDAEAWYELAESIFHGNPMVGEPIAASRHAFEETLRLDPDNFRALVHLARLAAIRADTAALDRFTAAALRGEPDGPHAAELLLLRAVGVGDGAAVTAVSATPVDGGTLDALWRVAEFSPARAATAQLARGLVRSTPPGEMRTSLHLLLAHLEAGRGCAPAANAYLDSVAARAPRAAWVTRGLFSLPAVGVGRAPPDLAAALAAGDTQSLSRGVYAGGSAPAFPAALAGALSMALDREAGTPAPTWAAGAPPSDAVGWTAAAYGASLGAHDGPGRALALAALARADSAVANAYVSPVVFFPRALVHLAAADVLEGEGRLEDALVRLEAVPEDLGFDVAMMATVHRRRAALHRALGHPREAAAEEKRARALRTGCVLAR